MPAAAAPASLLQPLRLGPLEARNRVVFASHVTNLAERGVQGQRMRSYYARRARGGAGVIILEEFQVHPSSHPYERALRGYEGAMVGPLRVLADELHGLGALVLAQLGHAGMQGTGHILKQPLWAPSAVINPSTLEMPKVMELEDIAAVVKGFARAARHAVAGGLDGVEINAGQHSLVRQFLSGLTNLREDEYGGDPERRLRFALDVIAAVRSAVGEQALVGLRLSCDELAPWAGIKPEDAPDLAAALSTGVDYVSVTVGSIYSVHATRAGLQQPPGYALSLSAAVRRRLGGIPVFASGSLVDPAQAAAAVVTGQADACEMTRALIADPDLPRKLSEGLEAEIRPCIRCNQDCAVRSPANVVVSCIHNPEAGHETELRPPAPAARRRRVVVVGGGPAGLEAARVSTLRGHRVTLLEREDLLGGTPRLVAESGQREPFGLVSGWLIERLTQLDVEVRLGVEANPALIRKLSPDLVIVATGGRPSALPGTISVRDALSGVLSGTGRVAVIDRQGYYPAIDAALYAAGRGRPVVIVTEDGFVSSQLGATGELTPWYQVAAAAGIELRPFTRVLSIDARGLRVRHRFGGGPGDWLKADCVILADYELPEDGLYRELLADGATVSRVGDCVAPRRVMHAILEGGRAAREA